MQTQIEDILLARALAIKLNLPFTYQPGTLIVNIPKEDQEVFLELLKEAKQEEEMRRKFDAFSRSLRH